MSAIFEYAAQKEMSQLNLHLGCGGMNLEGWINIDLYEYDLVDTSRSGAEYDVKMDIRALDIPDGSVANILLVHVIEHFVRWETVEMLGHYYRKLAKGGRLIVEMPDLDRVIEWYLAGTASKQMETPLGTKNKGFTQFYGNQWSKLDFETHRYVWTQQEFREVLENAGFEKIKMSNDAQFHEKGRDMFVVAEK